MSPFDRMDQNHQEAAIRSCFGSIVRPEKRGRDSGGGVRPPKRVTFSSEDCILGRAQDYDRRSFEEPTPAYASPHPSFSSGAAFAGSDGQEAAANLIEGGHANFCGMWRRSHSFNWSALLELSGVPKDAIRIQLETMKTSSVVHFIDHDDVSFRLVVNNESGHTTQDQHLYIGGQPRPHPYSSSPSNPTTSTLANMRWTKNGQALILTTVDAATGDEMTVSRRLGMGGAIMVQHYRARCARTGDSAEAVTIFRRI